MLKIKQYPTGPLSVNTYLVCDDASKECVIIDLGGEIDKIYNDINEFGGDLKYILNTHGHFDHIWGEKEAQDKYQVNNVDLARFLLPKVTDPDTTNYHYSMGTVYLPVSKVVSAEADTEDMTYENMAEIIQFTTLTGRRTNFATTIGNVNVKAETGEYLESLKEKDTAATEVITLSPPTGLNRIQNMIVNTVQASSKLIIIVAIIIAVIVATTISVPIIIKHYKNRPIK